GKIGQRSSGFNWLERHTFLSIVTRLVITRYPQVAGQILLLSEVAVLYRYVFVSARHGIHTIEDVAGQVQGPHVVVEVLGTACKAGILIQVPRIEHVVDVEEDLQVRVPRIQVARETQIEVPVVFPGNVRLQLGNSTASTGPRPLLA